MKRKKRYSLGLDDIQADTLIPATKVALLNRRLKSTSKRIERLKNEQKALAEEVRKKGRMSGKEFERFSDGELTSARAQLKALRSESRAARNQYSVVKRDYALAVKHNTTVQKGLFRKVRAVPKSLRDKMRLVDEIVKGLKKAHGNGSQMEVDRLIGFSEPRNMKDFEGGLDALLPSIGADISQKMALVEKAEKKTILAKVMSRMKVSEQTTSTAPVV